MPAPRRREVGERRLGYSWPGQQFRERLRGLEAELGDARTTGEVAHSGDLDVTGWRASIAISRRDPHASRHIALYFEPQGPTTIAMSLSARYNPRKR